MEKKLVPTLNSEPSTLLALKKSWLNELMNKCLNEQILLATC